MNYRIAGCIAMLTAPFLWIDFMVNGAPEHSPSLMGLFGLLYMGGWMVSIISLDRLKAAGNCRWGGVVFILQLLFLAIAQFWNILVLIQADQSTPLFFITDKFWPLSNLFMIVTGATVLKANKLPAPMRWIPLLVGLWLPISILLMIFLGRTGPAALLSGAYSTIMWGLLGWSVFSIRKKNKAEEVSPSMALETLAISN